jgi:hypothetical protein
MSEIKPAAIGTTRSPPGFRFSTSDALVILAALAATALLLKSLGSLALLPVVVLGHFFLFCNLFRVRRTYELVWGVLFVINLSAWWVTGNFGWGRVLLVQTPVTLICLLLEIFSPRYHGVGCGWLRRLRGPRE